MRKNIFLMVVVTAVAAVLRLYQLGNVPVSLDWDETALGYNAYSILKTGKDEYGTFLPLSIRSFDDYKPPLYTYLTVPSVALFGLSPWSTRLPSAVMGILAVIGVYYLVLALLENSISPQKMTNNKLQMKNHFQILNFKFQIALISSLLLAISPWHIQFSRIAFEANIGVTVNIWAVALFLAGLRKKMYLLFSAALFGVGMYAYHSERIFLPLLLCLLLFVYRKKIFVKEYVKTLVFSAIIGLVVALPLIPVLFNKSAMMRLRGTSSFTDQTDMLSRDIGKIETDRLLGDKFGELLDNRRIVWAKTIISGYLSHFSLRWLFLTGDNARHHAPDMGLLYFWELPFLLYGIYILFKSKIHQPEAQVLIGWLLLAPVAASPTTGLPHAVRTLVFLPAFQIITAVGIIAFFKIISGWIRYAAGVFVLCMALVNMLYYLNMYFVHMNPEFSEYWQYGNKEAVMIAEKIKTKYKKVVVSTAIEQSYMFFLFYTKYDPVAYLANGGTNSGSFEEVKNKFDIYEFRKIHWSEERRDTSILYIGSPSEIPHGNIANIYFPNGKRAIIIADQPNGAL